MIKSIKVILYIKAITQILCEYCNEEKKGMDVMAVTKPEKRTIIKEILEKGK